MKSKLPWWDRLNGKLFPYLGPPALGPYDEPPLAPTGPKACPVCGARMDEHEIERGEGRTPTRIHCPRDSGRDAAPVVTAPGGLPEQ